MDGDTRIEITVAGMTGEARFTAYGVELRGRWASHTGYRHHTLKLPPSADSARDLAHTCHAAQAAYAFAVGDEHRDVGWRTLRTYDGRIEVRLPSWHAGRVSEVLEAMGWDQQGGNALNDTWGLAGASLSTVRKALAPILAPGMRFTPEADLAEQLRISARRTGLLDAPVQSTFNF